MNTVCFYKNRMSYEEFLMRTQDFEWEHWSMFEELACIMDSLKDSVCIKFDILFDSISPFLLGKDCNQLLEEYYVLSH